MPETLTITDNRTAISYEVPLNQGTIRTMDLRKMGWMCWRWTMGQTWWPQPWTVGLKWPPLKNEILDK